MELEFKAEKYAKRFNISHNAQFKLSIILIDDNTFVAID